MVFSQVPFGEYTANQLTSDNPNDVQNSVYSRAAAIALTSLFGEDFAFDDTTEEEYGLPMRSFTSFKHASEDHDCNNCLQLAIDRVASYSSRW